MPLFVAHGGQWREVPRYHAKAATYGNRHHFSNIAQIYVAHGGQWRPLWVKRPDEVMYTGVWHRYAGRAINARRPDPNNLGDFVALWGSASIYMVDWDSGNFINRARPITGIRLRVRTNGGASHGMDVWCGSYQDFERRGVNFGAVGNGGNNATRAQHDRLLNCGIPPLWGNRGVHHCQWPRHTLQDSPWLDCWIPVGESLVVIYLSHFGQDRGDANDLSILEIIDIRYG